MKKLILSMLLLPVLATAQIGSASTTISVSLSEVYSIEVNHPTVNLIVDEPSEYINGTSVDLNNHITITSTVPYEISISLNQNYTNGTDDIPVEQISLQLLDGTTSINNIPLSLSDVNIIPLSNPVITRNINAKYVLAGGDELLVSPGIYTATATLTLTPQ